MLTHNQLTCTKTGLAYDFLKFFLNLKPLTVWQNCKSYLFYPPYLAGHVAEKYAAKVGGTSPTIRYKVES